MKLALGLDWWSDESLVFAQQLGVTHVVGQVRRWSRESLVGGAHRARVCGLTPAAVEGLPRSFLTALLGEQERGVGNRTQIPDGHSEQHTGSRRPGDPAIRRLQEVLSFLGEAEIPVLSMNWDDRMPLNRTEQIARGGATARVFRAKTSSAQSSDVYGEHTRAGGTAAGPASDQREQAWSRLGQVLDSVLPTAEKNGTAIALKPSVPGPPEQPPGPPAILTRGTELARVCERYESPTLGIDLCLDSLFVTEGRMFPEVVHALAAGGRTLLVRAGRLHGDPAVFREQFPDADDSLATAIRQLVRLAVDAPIRPGSLPRFVDDTQWGHTSHALATGYLRGLLQSL